MKNSKVISPSRSGGFTLVEVLVATAIFILILTSLAIIITSTSHALTYTSGKAQQFRAAREAFEEITRRIGQATLNTYWDYVDANGVPNSASYSGTFIAASYVRQSELRFISGPSETNAGVTGLLSSTSSITGNTHAIFFQAPAGVVSSAAIGATPSIVDLNSLLNTFGFFIQFGQATQPSFIATASPYRYRLMEMIEPSDTLTIYGLTSGQPTYTAQGWFTTPLAAPEAPADLHILADNIVALILLPKLTPVNEGTTYTDASLAPNYAYDTTATNADPNLDPKNQLPPVVQVTMVAIDEASATRLAALNGSTAPNLGLSGLFATAGNYAVDLDQLEANLLQKTFTDSTTGIVYNPKVTLPGPMNFRVFTINVSIRGAEWSTAESN